jgi:hypothetical protein
MGGSHKSRNISTKAGKSLFLSGAMLTSAAVLKKSIWVRYSVCSASNLSAEVIHHRTPKYDLKRSLDTFIRCRRVVWKPLSQRREIARHSPTDAEAYEQ